MTKQKGHPTSLDKLLNSGHEAAIDESLVDDTAIPDKSWWLIKVSENGHDALLELATIGVLEYQRDLWERAVMDGAPLDGEIYADIGAQEALYAVQNMERFQFPTVADTNSASSSDPAILSPDDYYKWVNVEIIKEVMPYVPDTQLLDVDGNPLPDGSPVLVLAPRKYGGFGGVVFYHDTWPDTDNWALYVTKAVDFVADHPEYHDWLISNGGYVSDTDLIFQLHLTREHFLNSQYVINFFLNLINQATLNIDFTNVLVSFPSTGPGPGGTWPPGTNGPPDSTLVTTPPPGTNDHVFNCGDYPVFEYSGCNEIVLAQELNFVPLPTLPIPVQKQLAFELYNAIVNQIQATGTVPDVTKVDEVELCIQFAYLATLIASADGFSTQSLTSLHPYLHIHQPASGSDPEETYNKKLLPSEQYLTDLFSMKMPELPITLQAKALTFVSDDPNSVIIEEFDKVDSIQLIETIMPTVFGTDNNPFEDQSSSPHMLLSLKRVREKRHTWPGLAMVGGVTSNQCTVYNIAPAFLQNNWGGDINNADGPVTDIINYPNWVNADAVLFEVYVPAPSGGMWMEGSGGSSQGIIDAWRSVNPLAHHDLDGNLVIFREIDQINRICYTWLKVPPGQTNFAASITPVPLSCWVKIVAWHNATTGEITVQADANKCGSITYPTYPPYPY